MKICARCQFSQHAHGAPPDAIKDESVPRPQELQAGSPPTAWLGALPGKNMRFYYYCYILLHCHGNAMPDYLHGICTYCMYTYQTLNPRYQYHVCHEECCNQTTEHIATYHYTVSQEQSELDCLIMLPFHIIS